MPPAQTVCDEPDIATVTRFEQEPQQTLWNVVYVTVIAKETVRIGYVILFQAVVESATNKSVFTDKPSIRHIPTPKLRRHAWPMADTMASEGLGLQRCLSYTSFVESET